MKRFFEKNWGKILLAILLIIISILSFKFGYSYLSNDNYSPDLNPLLTIQRSIQSPAWRSYRVLGFASESEQADIFRSVLYYILDIFLPTWSLSQVFALLCFVVGGWFTALLTSNLITDFGKKRYSELGFLLGGLFYIGTLWTVWVFYQNMFPYIAQFGFLPLVVWSIHRFVKDFNWKNSLILFISMLFFTSTFVIATLFIVDIVLISILSMVFAIAYSKKIKEALKKVVVTILLVISTQLFWILPFIHYTAYVSEDIVESYVNRGITTSVIDLESRDQNALNSAKLFSRTVLEKDENTDEYIFKRADEYATYDFFNVIGLIPAILTLVLLLFSLVKKKWIYSTLAILAILVWFVIKNINPPLGSIFIWAQENIPLFKQVFRWASSKTGNVFLLLLSICAPAGFIYLIDFLVSFVKKPLRIIIFVLSTVLIIVPTLFYSQYLFTGDIYPQRALIQIPNEYHDLKTYIEDENIEQERILYLPPANNNYFRIYDWGFWGSNFISYILPNPIVDLSSAIGSKYGEEAVLEIQEAFRSKDGEKLDRLISKYEIDYLLVDKTLKEEGFTFSWDWNVVDTLWQERPLAYSSKNLYLYDTDFRQETFLLESNSQEDNTFKYIKESQNPEVSLNPENYKDWNLENNFLISSYEHIGNGTAVTNQISIENILKNPTLVSIQNDNIYLYPAVPVIEEINTDIYKKYEYEDADYIVINDNVFDVSDISQSQSYAGIEENFGFNHEVYLVSNSEFTTDNLTSILSQSTPYECISGQREETTEVTLQGDATGFDLKGKEGNPCIYSKIDFNNRDSDKVLKININWETLNNSLLGYCIYSENEQRCLNRDRYFSAQEGIGSIEHTLDKTVSKSDYLSLIIYTINPSVEPNVTIRNVSVGYAPVRNKTDLLTQKVSEYKHTMLLENGRTYEIKIPVLAGRNSYNLANQNTTWQPDITEDNTFTLYNKGNGIYQEVIDGFANSSVNLFNAQPLSKYLIYWKGENISNIPANICLAYSDENECWIQNVFYDSTQRTNLEIFTSDQRIGRFDLSMISTSYNLKTQNLLKELLVMKYPQQWQDLVYIPDNVSLKNEIELKSVGNFASTIYSTTQGMLDNIVTIPQAYEKGWIAIAFENNIPKIVGNRVLVNGWKQGWDISDVDYDSILVLYYPNLLAYLGYLIWISVFVVILSKVLIKKNER
jgi:hypothetical protein